MWRLKSRLPPAFNEGLGNDARDVVTGESGGIARGSVGTGRSLSDTEHRLAIETFLVHLHRDFAKLKLWQERCGILIWRVAYCFWKLRREEGCEHALVRGFKQG